MKRKQTSFSNEFSATFIHKDCSVKPEEFFSHDCYKEMEFDIVSCQFSMHYMFCSEEKVRNFLGIASQKLLNGGYFIATHPDANVLVKKFRDSTAFVDPETGFTVSENKYYSLICQEPKFPRSNGAFGFAYGYFLTDNLVGFEEKNEETGKVHRHYVPEYLIILNNFLRIAEEYGFELVETKNFHEFYGDNVKTPKFKELFKRMMLRDSSQNETQLMDKELWDTSYLYRVLVLKKIKGGKTPDQFNRKFKPRHYFKLVQEAKKNN